MKEIILTTTSKISNETVAFLSEEAKKTFGADKIVHRIDNSIVGGFTVKCDGLFYDMSISAQLFRIKEALKSQEAGK